MVCIGDIIFIVLSLFISMYKVLVHEEVYRKEYNSQKEKVDSSLCLLCPTICLNSNIQSCCEVK
jgi:hypothetical protein